jgi:hypothetical protein
MSPRQSLIDGFERFKNLPSLSAIAVYGHPSARGARLNRRDDQEFPQAQPIFASAAYI